jgi:hypothetical protein
MKRQSIAEQTLAKQVKIFKNIRESLYSERDLLNGNIETYTKMIETLEMEMESLAQMRADKVKP